MPTPKASGAKKPATKRAAPRKVPRAEAQKAVEEIKAKPKTTKFRGIELTIPPVLPASFAFDAIEMEEAGGAQLGDVRRLVVGVVGVDQWKAMRDKIAADGDSMEDIASLMEELFEVVFTPYGLDLGESEASATS